MVNTRIGQGLNSRTSVTKQGILKRLAKKEPARIEKMCKVLLFCRKKGVKVPKVIDYGNDWYFLERVQGRPFNGSVAQIKSIAKELAVLHKALARCTISYPFAPNEKLYGRVGRKKEQLIHFDVQPGNVLFKGNRVSAILDFDAMRKGSAIEEVAFSAFRFAVYKTSDPKDVKQRMRLFLNAYGKKFPMKKLLHELILRLKSMEQVQLKQKHPNKQELKKFRSFLKFVSKIV